MTVGAGDLSVGLEPFEAPPLGDAGAPRPRKRRRLPEPIRLLLANPKSCFGIILLFAIVFAAIAAPLLTNSVANEPDALPRQAPSWEYPFGTTDQGYNIFAQVLYGARVSLGVALVASLIAMTIAITLGLLPASSRGLDGAAVTLLQNVVFLI